MALVLKLKRKYYKALILSEEGEKEEALRLINEAEKDFELGFFHSRPYVEVLRQIYIEDILKLKNKLIIP